MGLEIERRFLVDPWRWQATDVGERMVQGYLSAADGQVVRVRLCGRQGWLTVKGPKSEHGRLEFEYPISAADAECMLSRLCGGRLVEKTRHRAFVDGNLWEVDVFHGANLGLVIAEIELPRVDAKFSYPRWALEEVTDDPRYCNSALAVHPFSVWNEPAEDLLAEPV